MILIVTNKQDLTADFFILKAKSIGLDYYRLNTEDFPTEIDMSIGFNLDYRSCGFVRDKQKRILFSEINGIWYRRPKLSEISNDIKDYGIRDFCAREATSALDGALKTIDCNWVSHPDRVRAAESKVFQLNEARRVGFRIPKTLITNNREELIDFVKTIGSDVIIKTLSSGRVKDASDEYLIYTNLLDIDDAAYDSASYTANFVQEYVEPQTEIRVTVIGEHVFATRITPEDGLEYGVDWRRHQDRMRYEVMGLPVEVEKMSRYLVRRFGLSFSAMDFILDTNNEYCFLEMNPNGQWAWIEQMTGVPMFNALVETLCARR